MPRLRSGWKRRVNSPGGPAGGEAGSGGSTGLAGGVVELGGALPAVPKSCVSSAGGFGRALAGGSRGCSGDPSLFHRTMGRSVGRSPCFPSGDGSRQRTLGPLPECGPGGRGTGGAGVAGGAPPLGPNALVKSPGVRSDLADCWPSVSVDRGGAISPGVVSPLAG